MNLNEITRQVLSLVETKSGIPVHVEPDPNLPGTLLAKVVMARGALALHRVSYRPDSAMPPDYLICKQAGYILRVFDTPPAMRFDFAASPEGDAAVESLVKAHPVAKALELENPSAPCEARETSGRRPEASRGSRVVCEAVLTGPNSQSRREFLTRTTSGFEPQTDALPGGSITGESFFQKNRPAWPPERIEPVTLGEGKHDYRRLREGSWLADIRSEEKSITSLD